MKRRHFGIAAGSGVVALAAGALPVAAQQPLTLIYIGGWDCSICLGWKSNEKPVWMKSEASKKIRYVEVETVTINDAYSSRLWPAELRPILAQVREKYGTPRFLLVRDGQIIANQAGSGWSTMVAEINKLVG